MKAYLKAFVPFAIGILCAAYWTDMPIVASQVVAFCVGVTVTAVGGIILAMPPEAP